MTRLKGSWNIFWVIYLKSTWEKKVFYSILVEKMYQSSDSELEIDEVYDYLLWIDGLVGNEIFDRERT